MTSAEPTPPAIRARARVLFEEHRRRIMTNTDRMFAGLIMAQWLVACALAVWLSPYTWEGERRALHPHLYLAFGLGGIVSSLPVALALLRPGRTSTRHVITAAQLLWSALLIHLTGGRIETHFHVFGSLALLAFYRDPRVFLTAVLVVGLDHGFRGTFYPESVYGVSSPEWWRFIEHALWVVFESTFLVIGTRRAVWDMRETALHRATAEALNERQRQKLVEGSQQLAEAQELARLGSWELEVDRGSMSWSAELYRIFGVDPQSFTPTAEALIARVHPQDRARVEEALDCAGRDGTPFDLEARVGGADGEVAHVHMRTRAMCSTSGMRLMGTVQEITELRRMREALTFADRMTSIGTLAAGVAHEINNPLAFLSSNVAFVARELSETRGRFETLLTERLKVLPRAAEAHDEAWRELGQTGDDIQQALDEAMIGTDRVRDIVRDLKTFSRMKDDAPDAPVDVVAAVEFSVKMAAHQVRSRARLVKQFGPVPPVAGSQSKLGQVFLNLVINAAQAMEGRRPEENELRVVTRTAADGRAIIEVADNGPGIPAQIRHRIFDAFFTTKAVGSGTGLGLAICHEIVRSLGGTIELESEEGRGTTFRVTLPAAPASAVSVAPATGGGSMARACVLIVDDEPLVLSSLRRLLGSFHDVEEVPSGYQALDLVRSGRRYDAVLCDVMMPGMDGVALAQRLGELAPDQADRLIFLTGGVTSGRAQEALDRTGRPVLDKPCDRDRLLEEIRKVMGTGEDPGSLAA